MREILMGLSALAIYLGIIGVLIWDTLDTVRHQRHLNRSLPDFRDLFRED